MSLPSLATTRVLAIDPTSKGFGFAILEGPEVLINWGVKYIRGDQGERNRRSLQEVSRLITRYQTDLLVVERTTSKSCQRRSRARQLIAAMLSLASDRDLRVRQVSRGRVERCFSKTGTATKRQVAVAITVRFPELAPSLPPVRKPWMSEDQRMSIFDAVAFGYASYDWLRREQHALSLLSLEIPQSHA